MNRDEEDKLFLTELLNDLYRNGFTRGGKAEAMLHAWGRELRDKTRASWPASRLRKTFSEIVGGENW